MLSYLYRLAINFEHEHGIRPNLLYLNSHHFQSLRRDLAAIQGLGELVRFLGMEVIVEPEVNHPHVCLSQAEWQTSIAV